MIITKEHEQKVSSQFGEDGIIQTILGHIGEGNKTFIEIGTGDGNECNCINLRRNHGWKGVLIDCGYSNSDVEKRWICAENVQKVIRDVGGVEHPDVFSLDIDGNDWWVLANIGPYVPRLLVCEFNGHFTKDECRAKPYDPLFFFCGTRFYGGSAKAMHRLANELGLALVFSNYVNMFFVANEYKHLFDNADNDAIYTDPWSHPDDPRMHLMIDPFTVERPNPIS